MQFVLASASPRRARLLSDILPVFEVIPAKGEEIYNDSLFPEKVAMSLAESKCDEVFEKNQKKTVIGCDTVVVYKKKILGKPKNEADAVAMLKELSGNTHYVITGVCVRSPYKKLVDYDRTEVKMNALTEDFIVKYVAGGSPMDKAGAYGIQDEGVVSEYFGSYTNVVGLPVTLARRMIEEAQEE